MVTIINQTDVQWVFRLLEFSVCWYHLTLLNQFEFSGLVENSDLARIKTNNAYQVQVDGEQYTWKIHQYFVQTIVTPTIVVKCKMVPHA